MSETGAAATALTAAAPPDATAPAPMRGRLLAAARAVIERGGYAGASVAAIASEAEVSAGALYRHFPSKSELFADVFREVCGHEIDAVHAVATTHAGDAVARIDTVITAFAERALLNPTLAWALIAEPVDPAVERVRLEFRASYRTMLAEFLREAIAARAAPPQDPDLTAAALVGAANEVLAGPLAPALDDHRDPAETVEALRTLWRRTIGA